MEEKILWAHGTKELETERLRLRKFRKEDAAMMFRNWAGDDEITRYLSWKTHANIHVSEEFLDFVTTEYRRPDYFNWCLELKETGEAVGSVGCDHVGNGSAEIGWCISRVLWGRGLVPEAVKEIFRFLFCEAKLERIGAYYNVLNPKSGRVMQKSGMRYLGEVKNGAKDHDGNPIDIIRYEITREEFLGKKSCV